MKKLIIGLMVFLLTSCASIHSGKYGREIRSDGSVADQRKASTASGFLISGDTDKSMSSDFYKFMVFTVENRKGDIAEISDVAVRFPENNFNEDVRITSGQELERWYDATIAEKQRREENRATTFSFAAIGGGLLAAFTDSSWSNVGIAVFAGGIASMTVDELYKNKQGLERGKIFPDTHIMSGKFQVPAGLYQRKWIVFNVKDKYNLPERLNLSYRVEGREETVMIPLKW